MKKRRESKENSYVFVFKILVCGDSSKTSVIQRYLTGFFKKNGKMTIGVDFEVKSLEINGKKIKLQIWDFGGGDERFRLLLPTYVRGANGAILIYDISNRATFINLYDWIQSLRECPENIPIILAGVSIGSEENRTISSDEGLKVAKKYNLDGFIEVSPKTDENVGEMFTGFAKIIVSKFYPDVINEFRIEKDVE